jgi:hypothetical protein
MHNSSYHKKDNYQFSTRRHVLAKYNHHQANIASKFRYIKCAPNGIPLCLQYCSIYPCNSMLLHGHMEQYCKHNGIQLGAHFIYLNFDAILA